MQYHKFETIELVIKHDKLYFLYESLLLCNLQISILSAKSLISNVNFYQEYLCCINLYFMPIIYNLLYAQNRLQLYSTHNRAFVSVFCLFCVCCELMENTCNSKRGLCLPMLQCYCFCSLPHKTFILLHVYDSLGLVFLNRTNDEKTLNIIHSGAFLVVQNFFFW